MLEGLVYFIENGDFNLLLLIFGFYFLIIWILVPVWVFLDSKKRFENPNLSILLFLLILPFNLPGLFFYIIIRPEEHHHSDTTGNGLISVPIANFLDANKKDLLMSLEIKINGDIIKNEKKHDLNLDVTLNSDNESMSISTPEVKVTPQFSPKAEQSNATSEDKTSTPRNNPFKGLFDTVKGLFITEVVEEEVTTESPEVKKPEENKIKKKDKKSS